jgi:hypothetical protein
VYVGTWTIALSLFMSRTPGALCFAPTHMWAAHVMPTGGTHMNVNAKLGALGE